ncbi:MAG TPA: hypothetical protein VIX19_10810 [Terriglobales bacterium]
MLRYQSFASMLRATGLGLLWALLPPGCAYAQTQACFQTGQTPTLQTWITEGSCYISGSAGTVTYTWNSTTDNPAGYVCTSNPTSLCPTASQINVSQTPTDCKADDGNTGNEEYSILWVQSDSRLNVSTSGDYINIIISGTVSMPTGTGNHNNWNWPHFDCQSQEGQTGYGIEVNETDVDCGTNCTENANMKNLGGASQIICNASDNPGPPNPPSIYCTDYTPPGTYNPLFNATFSGAGPYDLTVKLSVKVPSEQTGSAFLYSAGTHLNP